MINEASSPAVRRRAVGDVVLRKRPRLDLGVVRQRIAGDERPRRDPRVDQRGALLGVGLRQQALGRHLHERRVGVVGVAVGVGQLHRLGHGVHVVGAVVPHRRQVEGLEDVERLQQHRALAREAVLVDGVAAVGRRRRLLDAGEVLGEVAGVERRLVLLQERHHLLGDVALVEAIAGGGDAGRAAAPLGAALGLDHPRERARRGRQLDGLAGRVRRAVGLQPVALVVGPLFEELELADDTVGSALAQREAVARVLDRPGRDGLERQRAPALEDGERGVECARHHGRVEPRALEGLAARQIPVDVDGLGGPPLPDHRGDLLLSDRIDEDERLAAQAVEVLLDHPADEQRRHAGVEGVAALEQHFERRGSDERVPGRDAAVGSGHQRPQRRRRRRAAGRRFGIGGSLLGRERGGQADNG